MALSLNRAARLRFRRLFRRRQKIVEAATQNAGAQFETDLINRFDRLLQVKRFVSGWLALVLLISLCTVLQTLALNNHYQTLQPVSGGVYNEGIVGAYSNANPLYASGSVDSAVSRLIFAGLLKYDAKNQLVGDLASSYSVDATGQHYTVKLRPNLKWHDNKPLTAVDVAFTYHTIQNPDARSPLLPSWQGITITATDSQTITFDLPNVLSSFPYSLTNGIVPEHILASVPPTQLRTNTFNTLQPVGAGPFMWQTLELGHSADPAKATSFVALQPFKDYYGGAPKLDGIIVRAYASRENMIEAYENRDINAMAGLIEVPKQLRNEADLQEYSFASTAALMTFFRGGSGVLIDGSVRQALIKGANVADIIKGLPYQPKAVREPLLLGQLGYDMKFQQSGYDEAAANAQLDAAGWIKGANGIRSKNGQPLSFRLYAENTPENTYVIKKLITDWKKIGANVSPVLQDLTDFQTTLEFHTYDALLYGISVGTDPDVYAYWDSTQADVRAASRLNFSEYSSTTADASLEAGRTRLDANLRVIKYRPFLQAWQADAPALGLYQPRFLYISRGPVYGLSERTLNTDSDRYNTAATWQIRTTRVTNE